jgi:putative ABC transport system ATP-binding protein
LTATSSPTTASTAAAPPVVIADGVGKTYGVGPGAFTALREVSLSINPGRMVALVGRSGSGKSTLLNLLGAVDQATVGSIRIGGTDLSAMRPRELALFRRRRLGFVFQSFHLLPNLSVFDNVAVPWVLDRQLTAARRSEIHVLFDRLGLGDRASRYPDELSGGQQQRVALARAVIHRPQLVLADEPTGNLDAQSGRMILSLLAELQEQYAVTVIMATHSEEAAERCADRVVLDDGRIVELRGEIRGK